MPSQKLLTLLPALLLLSECWAYDGVFWDSFDTKSPTVVADPHLNVTAATRKLRHAMEGYGTNENQVINVLTTVDFNQRKQIEAAYKQLFKRNLASDLKSELSGSFEDFSVALIQEPDEVIANDLYAAMKGWGTDEDTITEILGCQNSENINRIASKYRELHKASLESTIQAETSSSYWKLLHALLTKRRGSVGGSPEKIAQALIRAGFGKSGKMSESLLIDLLTSYSFDQLATGLARFREIVGMKQGEPIHHGYSGDFGKALSTIVSCAENRPAMYAHRLKESFGRFRNDDRTLIRIIVLRSGIDLNAIKKEYERLFRVSLKNDVSKSIKADLRHGLLSLIGR